MTTFVASQLDRHAGALRRLARALVRDAHLADDLVQETWLCALRSPPRRAGDPGAWLRTVLRSLAAKVRRTDVRRSRREAAVAREEGGPDPDTLVERQHALTALIAAVGALPHGQQTCVWLRYFDGRSPRAIAAQLGVPVATVHSRLLRAHVALRARLSDDGRNPRWAVALSGAVGLPFLPAALGGATLGGAALLTMNKKLLLGFAAGVAFGLVGLRLAIPPVEPAAPIAASEPAALAWREGPALAATPARAPLPEPTSAAAPAPPQPFRFALDVLALDADDLPAADARVLLGVPGHPVNVAGETDTRGRLRVEWRGRLATMDVFVGEGPRLQRLTVTAGEARTVLLRPRERAAVTGVASIVIDRGTAGGSLEVPSNSFTVRALRVDARALEMDRLEGDLRGFVTSARRGIRRANGEELVESEAAFAFGLEAIDRESTSPVIRGVVRDAAGRPAAHCAIALLDGETGAVRNTTTTDAAGRYRLPVPVGAAVVRAGGGRHGLAWHRATVAEHDQLTWDPQLDRGYELKGRLVSAAGTPLAGWRVEAALEHATEPFSKSGRTEPDGSFAIPNVPLANCVVRAFHPDCGPTPVHTFLPQMPGAAAVTLEVPASATALGLLGLLARTRDQRPVADTEFVVQADAATHAVRLRGDDAGAIKALALPFGTYTVLALAPGRHTRTVIGVQPMAASVSAETIWLEPTVLLSLRVSGRHDVNVRQLAPEVVLRVDGGDEGRGDFEPREAVEAHEWLLSPGEYVIETAQARRRVELRAGEPQTLDLTERREAPR